MIRLLGVIIAGVSAVLFPWPFTVLLALSLAPFEPLAPLAVGLLTDTLYYSHAGWVPIGTLCGALATGAALFVRRRLKAGMIGE